MSEKDIQVLENEFAKSASSKAKATLVSFTPNPIKTVLWALKNQHFDIPDDISKMEISKEEETEFLQMILRQHHTSVLEYINTTWKLENVSRAFQTQLIRTRQASYSIQSLRIVDVGAFAKKGIYHIPEKIQKNEAMLELFKAHMDMTEKNYRALVQMGATPEDARGVLPLNIYSPITMTINMRSLISLLENRLCLLAQGEFRDIAAQMRAEVCKKIHPGFGRAMVPPCVKTGVCPMVLHCGLMSYPQGNTVDISRWVKDKTRVDEKGRVVKNW